MRGAKSCLTKHKGGLRLDDFIRRIGSVSILIALCIPIWAQQRNTAGIYGRVTDPQGASVTGAKITLTQVETGIQRISASNAAGEWEFPSIAVGAYSLS